MPGAPILYVIGSSGTVTRVDTATSQARPVIKVRGQPTAVAVAPDGRIVYVASLNAGVSGQDGTVTPITTATNQSGTPINVGDVPDAIAITPDGQTAYVASQDGTITPITTATNQAGKPIKVGGNPIAIAITPDGQTAYVVASPRAKDCSPCRTPPASSCLSRPTPTSQESRSASAACPSG
jgi:YVTN family beta-propeller protein